MDSPKKTDTTAAPTRSLSLKKRVLFPLTPDELSGVVGGDNAAFTDPNGITQSYYCCVLTSGGGGGNQLADGGNGGGGYGGSNGGGGGGYGVASNGGGAGYGDGAGYG